ncbi:MAG: alpha/beta hydrolase [Angelakisella sp.]
MEPNKMMLAALRALTYPDLDMKRNYKFVRQVVAATHFREKNPIYKKWDYPVQSGDFAVPTRIYAPPGNDNPANVLLFFHGGGWVHGSIDSYDKVCAHMAELTDCYCVARALYKANIDSENPKKITLIGDSAGGNLAAALSLLAQDRGEFQIKQQILLYPATYNDHSDKSPFNSIRENGTDYLLTSKRVSDYLYLYAPNYASRNNPYFAPLLAKDLHCQPKTLIITAEFDPLRDEGEAYGKKLFENGVPVEIHRLEGALHGFFSLPPSFAQVKIAYDYINSFLNK